MLHARPGDHRQGGWRSCACFQRYMDEEVRSPALFGLDAERPADQAGAFAHSAQAAVILLCKILLHIKAHAIVLDLDIQFPSARTDLEPDARCPGVSRRVGKRLLRDAIDAGLDFGTKA